MAEKLESEVALVGENEGVLVEKLELEVAFLGENKGVLAEKLEGVLAELWVLVVADKLGLKMAL